MMNSLEQRFLVEDVVDWSTKTVSTEFGTSHSIIYDHKMFVQALLGHDLRTKCDGHICVFFRAFAIRHAVQSGDIDLTVKASSRNSSVGILGVAS